MPQKIITVKTYVHNSIIIDISKHVIYIKCTYNMAGEKTEGKAFNYIVSGLDTHFCLPSEQVGSGCTKNENPGVFNVLGL